MEYDSRLKPDYLKKNYISQCFEPLSDPYSFKRSHTWNHCGVQEWTNYWMPDKEWDDFINKVRLYRNVKYRYPFDGLNAFEKRFTKPPRHVEFHSY